MDRLIKFRGKLTINEQWIFGGYLAPNRLGGFYEDDRLWTAEVHPETVGQFTGFKDVDGKEIYEGDIIQNDAHPDIVERVFTCGGCWSVGFYADEANPLAWTLENAPFKVIGNIHDNPELLEGGNTSIE